MKTLVVAAAALTLSAGVAFAQATTPEFPAVDTDMSGSLSLAELQVALPALTPEQFATVDTDASGGLSAEEYAALAAALGGAPAAPAPATP